MEKPTGVVDFRDWHAYKICADMREDEIAQYLALTDTDSYNMEVAARGFINMPGIRFSLVDNEQMPIIIGGYHEVASGVWQSWMAGTEPGWQQHWRSITKASRWLMERLFENGARRLQTSALASRTQAIAWYEKSLRMCYEGTWEGFAKDDQDVVCYGLTRSRFYGRTEKQSE